MSRRNYLKYGAAGVVAVAVVAAAGYGVYQTTRPPPKKGYTFYYNCMLLAHPYLIGEMHGIQTGLAQHSDLSVVTVDAKGDNTLEADQVRSAVSRRPDGIIAVPLTSDNIVPAAKEAKAAGIPMVNLDRDFDTSNADLRIGAITGNNPKMGMLQADYGVKYLEKIGRPTPWNVVILEGMAGVVQNTERTNGYLSILNPLKDQGKVNIVADVNADWYRETALEKMSEILAKTKKIDFVICSNDEEAQGAMIAAKSAGLQPGKDLFFIGLDGAPEGFASVTDGTQIGTVIQNAWEHGIWGVEMLYRYVTKGDKPPADKFPNGTIESETWVVDKSNIDQVLPYGEPKAGTVPPLPY